MTEPVQEVKEKTSSIEVKKGAKETYSWNIKNYFDNESEEKVLDRIAKINNALVSTYQKTD